jgi:sterol desaturase/sphingolipid hydroxylase (fatty acid hydroxylase superfamily)
MGYGTVLFVNMLVIDNVIWIRLGSFAGIFLLMAVWESAAPRRVLRTPKGARWFSNLSITVLNSLVGRFALPLPAAALALVAQERGLGLFHYLNVPSLPAGVLSIVLLDLAIYLQHVVFHRVRMFWYFHGMHHTDLDIDLTTGARFHPVEIVLSLLIKMGIIVLLGTPAWSFITFEVLLNATSMFNHSNISISTAVDRVLRLIVVTPDMHRVHHSVIIGEHDSNFGFNLPWWDRLFRTYKGQPRDGHQDMVIGLANFRDPKRLGLVRLMLLPFLERTKF